MEDARLVGITIPAAGALMGRDVAVLGRTTAADLGVAAASAIATQV